MVPVTNKLLIPCRVLDSHFCRLSDSVLTSPSRPFSSLYLSLPSQDSSSLVSSPFLNPRESWFSPTAHSPTPTASSNVHHPPPCRPPCNTRLAPCPRPTRSTTATPPSRRHFLRFSHSSSILFCFYTKADVGCMLVQMYLALDSSIRKARVRKTSCEMITRLRALP